MRYFGHAECWKRTASAAATHGRDDAGSVSLLMAILLVPVFVFAGLAVDYGRAYKVHSRMQQAVDVAAISAARLVSASEGETSALAQKFFDANSGDLVDVHGIGVTTTTTSDGLLVTAAGQLPTAFLGLLGHQMLNVSASALVKSGSDAMELALVLDNTGSMEPYMSDLRTAAKDLVTTLFGNVVDDSLVKIAVVPFAGTVNIGNGGTQMAWMDTNGDASWHGVWAEWWGFGYEPGCVYTPGWGPPIDPGPGGQQGSLQTFGRRFAAIVRELVGIGPAHAATAADVAPPHQFIEPCWIANQPKINHFTLLSKIPNASWKGCVEARPEPYDVTDEPPNPADPETLFVPWFWPDEPDDAQVAKAGYGFSFANNYLPDRYDLVPAPFTDTAWAWYGFGLRNLLKYNNTNAIIDETGPSTIGPNRACPDPIMPLSGDKSALLSKIDGLGHWHGSGTNAAEGMAWGWRVLSPEPPFSEGQSYGSIRKVVVLMSDGVNNADAHPDPNLLSEMTAYGYLGDGRLPEASRTYQGFRTHVNARLLQACSNAKAAGITIYTVTFGITDAATEQLYTDCATEPPMHYSASTVSDLKGAFGKIAGGLSRVKLVR